MVEQGDRHAVAPEADHHGVAPEALPDPSGGFLVGIVGIAQGTWLPVLRCHRNHYDVGSGFILRGRLRYGGQASEPLLVGLALATPQSYLTLRLGCEKGPPRHPRQVQYRPVVLPSHPWQAELPVPLQGQRQHRYGSYQSSH